MNDFQQFSHYEEVPVAITSSDTGSLVDEYLLYQITYGFLDIYDLYIPGVQWIWYIGYEVIRIKTGN